MPYNILAELSWVTSSSCSELRELWLMEKCHKLCCQWVEKVSCVFCWGKKIVVKVRRIKTFSIYLNLPVPLLPFCSACFMECGV